MEILIDYITPIILYIRRGRTYRYIAVIIDRLTKIKYYIPIETLEIKEFVKRFIEKIYNIYNLLDSIISDRDL